MLGLYSALAHRVGFAVSTDQELQAVAGLVRKHPELTWAAVVFGGIIVLTINFAWWLIALPGLINAHNDGRLLAAFAGSVGLVLVDVIVGIRAFRSATQVSSAINDTGHDHDDKD